MVEKEVGCESNLENETKMKSIDENQLPPHTNLLIDLNSRNSQKNSVYLYKNSHLCYDTSIFPFYNNTIDKSIPNHVMSLTDM